jgi:hypothetical protein
MTTTETTEINWRLSTDLRRAAATLSSQEARYLVDAYYIMQEDRMAADARVREMEKSGEPHAIISWLAEKNRAMEAQIKAGLAKYVEAHLVGDWLIATRGIGPVIGAGLLAHIDIERAKSPSAIWRYAGLDPTSKWGKGQKRPWNAKLKRLCWIIGESFVKTGGDGPYRTIYVERKELYTAKNLAGDYAETAARQLAEKNYGKGTEARAALEAGQLPAAQIHLRAQRIAVKLFLSHLWEEWRTRAGLPVSEPWVLEHGGHVHKIERPQ